MDYTSKENVEKYLVINIDTSYNAQITLWITAMSRWLDSRTNRTLVQDTESINKYDGDGTDTLLIDDCNTITSIEMPSGTAITPFEYPANKDAKTKLVLNSDVFTKGLQNVEVTGKFGKFIATPEDIEFACTVLVAGIVNSSMNQKDDVSSETVGKYSVSYRSPQERADYKMVESIIATHKRITV